MRIWIDFSNSPHVNFFEPIIRRLEDEHDLILTCRPLADTVSLLQQKGLQAHVVGRHYGASKIRKATGFWVRVLQLRSFLRERAIDVAISHSSFYSPVVARSLGVKSIYLNDNEHAEGNRISFLCASRIMVPEFISAGAVKAQWGNPGKLIRYPGVKEGIYLSALPSQSADSPVCQTSVPEIFIRPEPWTAQYYTGEVNFLDELIVGLKERFRVTLMPRGEQQASHYRQSKFAGVLIPEKPIDLIELASRCALFIGAGGTMTREAAVMGIPTISVYRGALLEVDRFLLAHGYMEHKPALSLDDAIACIANATRRVPNAKLLAKGAEAMDMIVKELLNLPGGR